MKSIQTLRVCLRSFALITIFLCSARYAAATTETLFTTQVPQQLNAKGSSTNYELGTKFISGVAGQVNAIRFWKSSKETGSHVGHIWSASGQLLASVNFERETASGWQQQSLATPLAVNANTVYVVTANTANGYYVSTNFGLSTRVVNQDLSSVVGNNGVIGPPGRFPTQSSEGSNYFRDVVFTPQHGALTSNPVNLNFGNSNVGSSSSQTVTLTNTTSGTLSISQVAVSGTGFSASGITVPLSLAKGSQASLKVTFTPTVMGTATGSVTVTSNASNPTLTVPLNGVGLMPKIAAVPASVGFGSVPVGVSNTQTLTVTNSGNANLIISQTTSAGTGFSVTGPALPTTVTPSTSVALTVRFSPGTVGTTSGTVSIGSNATPSPLAIPLTGTGITQSLTLSANPPTLAFGNVSPGSNTKQAVTLTNTGNSSISLSGLTSTGNYFSVSGLAVPVTLAAGQSSGFSVTFAPTTTGTFSGSVSVASTAVNSPLSIPVSGTGSASHYVTLSWTPSVSSVSGYDVYRGTQKGGPYTKITSSLVPGSTYNDATVQSGLTYYYVATAVSSNGMQSVFSSEISATIP